MHKVVCIDTSENRRKMIMSFIPFDYMVKLECELTNGVRGLAGFEEKCDAERYSTNKGIELGVPVEFRGEAFKKRGK